MDCKIYSKFGLWLLLASLITQVAVAQTKKKTVVPVRTVAKRATNPLVWARKMQNTVPATAAFQYEIGFLDANNEPITDTLIALTDTKRIQCIRRDKATNATVGLAKYVYWPSLNDAAEGKLLLIDGKDTPVGFWTTWYDHAPRDENKRMQVAYDTQGQQIAGSAKQWKEKKPGCDYVIQDALPLVRNKLTCQFCMGSSRTVVPVSLSPDALGIVIKMDIRDLNEGIVSFKNVAGLALAYGTGGTTAALGMVAKAWTTTGATEPSSTTCYYFVTTDGQAAQQWYASKGVKVPARETIIHASIDNPTDETRPIELGSPLQKVYVCVSNGNAQADATLTISVAEMRQPCQ